MYGLEQLARNRLKGWQIHARATFNPQISNLHGNQYINYPSITCSSSIDCCTTDAWHGGSMDPRSGCLCNVLQIGVKAVLNYTQQKARAEHSKKGKLRSKQIKYMNI